MLRVANKGALFKVYRGVVVTFAMTPLAARRYVVGNAGGCWMEIFCPPPRPSGNPPSTRQKSLVVPPEVPSAALRRLRTQKRLCVIVVPWGLPWLKRWFLLGAGPCSREHQPTVKILQATIVFRLKTSLDVPAPRGLPLQRRCPPRPPSGICLVKQYCPARVGAVHSPPSPWAIVGGGGTSISRLATSGLPVLWTARRAIRKMLIFSE